MHGIVRHRTGDPVSGVAVSNGRDVVSTGPDGRFELPDEGDFVVITRPTGFTAEPWWLRAAEGDEELRFVLDPQQQALPYDFVHLTDTHMTLPDNGTPGRDFGLYREGSLPEQLREFFTALRELAPSAQSVMITGDLVDHGLAEEYEAYIDALGASELPVHLIPGNHDHMNGRHGSVVSRNNYLTNTGSPELYERYLGPRWYSFDVAGLHVVTLDWHTHELGLDHETQNAWVKNDLARLPEGSPWMLLFHDQPGASILDEVPWPPIATFSGHWHTSRVVDVDGTLHVNSPTTFFASLDYSPPAFRVVRWDGEELSLTTRTLLTVEPAAALGDVSTSTFAASSNPVRDDAVLWRAELHAAAHRQRVEVVGDLVVAGGQIEDRPGGSVEAFDLETGEIRWRVALDAAVKTTPAVAGDTVVVATVRGDVVGLDRHSGDELWTVPSSDPLRRFAWGSPTVAGDRVYLGDAADLRCIDTRSGELLWRRTDLSPHHNLVNHAAPLLIGELLVMGFWPTPQHPIGLDARTGADVWSRADLNGDDPFEALKRLLIMGTAAYDETTDAVVMPAHGHTSCVDRESGATRWIAPHEGGFAPSTPVVTAGGYVVTVPGYGLRMLDRESGATVWSLPISGAAPFPMASYTKAPHPVLAAPTLVGGELLLPGLDGVIRRISTEGRLLGETQLAQPIAASLVQASDRVIAVGVDGAVIALSSERIAAAELSSVGAEGGLR